MCKVNTVRIVLWGCELAATDCRLGPAQRSAHMTFSNHSSMSVDGGKHWCTVVFGEYLSMYARLSLASSHPISNETNALQTTSPVVTKTK
eukprot:3544024-Pleurochrysis_carterae.AAC.5